MLRAVHRICDESWRYPPLRRASAASDREQGSAPKVALPNGRASDTWELKRPTQSTPRLDRLRELSHPTHSGAIEPFQPANQEFPKAPTAHSEPPTIREVMR